MVVRLWVLVSICVTLKMLSCLKLSAMRILDYLYAVLVAATHSLLTLVSDPYWRFGVCPDPYKVEGSKSRRAVKRNHTPQGLR